MSTVRLRLTAFYAGLLAGATGLLLGTSWLLLRDHLRATLPQVVADDALGALASQYVLAVVAVVLLACGAGWLVAGQVLGPIERAVAAQRRFVANASHELRTPVTAIRAGAEVALDDPDAGQDELRAVLHDVVAQTERTEHLMAALLALTTATDGTRADDPVALDVTVRRALPEGLRADVRLEPTTVRGDGTLLERAAANLLENAQRHGRVGGTVAVRLAAGTLTVANPGAVIAPEDLRRLATPFERLRRSAAGGSGLGLSIVDAVARAHGGRLELEAPASGGLVARLVLPVSGDEQVTGAAAPSASWTTTPPAAGR